MQQKLNNSNFCIFTVGRQQKLILDYDLLHADHAVAEV